jgi:DNA-binding NarL/FixJ family response regulator
MPIKVVIVEDDEYLRVNLAELIGGVAAFRVVGAYGDGQTALQEIPLAAPDVVLMDIQLPCCDGVECVRQLKAARPEVNFLMLTVHEDSERLFESLKAGASGYLLKRTSSPRLLQAIREVHAGGAPMTPQIARRVVRYFSAAVHDPSVRLERLTSGQKEFLDQLAAGYGYKEIAAHLGITIDGVRSYVRRIYEKLHVHSRTEAVVRYLQK